MSGKIVITGERRIENSWTSAASVLHNVETINLTTNNFKSAEYQIHVEHSSGIQAQKVLVMHNGTNSFLQEFAIMSDNNLLVSIGSSILSGNFYLNATPEVGVSGIMTCRLLKTNIT